MAMRYAKSLTFLMLTGFLLALGVQGCAPRRAPESAAANPPPTVAPAANEIATGHIVRDQNGQRYYVDSLGRRHLIVRELIEPPGVAGALYYIENDERPYTLDENGRLYYRGSSGRVFYLEDVGPGAVAEPEVIIREERPGIVVEPGYPAPRESCARQYDDCMDGCRGISPRQAYDRPNCEENCEVIRNGCFGR